MISQIDMILNKIFFDKVIDMCGIAGIFVNANKLNNINEKRH